MGVNISCKKRYEGVRFTVIRVMRGVGGGPISRKKAIPSYVPLEWPLDVNYNSIQGQTMYSTIL